MIIALQLLLSMALATPYADGWQSSSSGSGTCSHHGGIAGGSSGYYPNVSPTYAAPAVKTTAATTGWTAIAPTAHGADVVMHSVQKYNDQVYIRYMCVSGESKHMGSAILVAPMIWWSPTISPFVHPADPADEGNNLVVSLVAGNSISRIKSWKVEACESCLMLSKSTEGIAYGVNAEHLTNDELQKFKTADYISVTVNDDNFMISLAGSAAAIAATDAACNR